MVIGENYWRKNFFDDVVTSVCSLSLTILVLPMTKLVSLKLDGDLDIGVQVTLSIALEGYSPHKEITGNLPAVPELRTKIDYWRSNYLGLGTSPRILKAKKVTYDNSIIQKIENCKTSTIDLQQQLNEWLDSKSFRSLRETWLKELKENDSVRVLIRTSCRQVRQIPWHLWDLVEEYRDAPTLTLRYSDGLLASL